MTMDKEWQGFFESVLVYHKSVLNIDFETYNLNVI